MKRKLSIALTLLLCVAMSITAFASTIQLPNSRLVLQRVWAEPENVLALQMYVDVGETMPEIQDYKVTLADSPVVDWQGYAPYTDGVSWVFLVDTSKVSTSAGNEKIILTLTQLMELVGSNDNAMFAKMEMGVEDLAFLPRSLFLNIDLTEDYYLEDKTKDDLNSTVKSVLDFLSTSPDVKGRTNLVIVSKGSAYEESAVSTESLRGMIEESGVTVYTIAYTSGVTDVSAINRFGSLARSSRTGLAIEEPANDERKVTEAINSIRANEAKFRVLRSSKLGAITDGMVTVQLPKYESNGVIPSDSKELVGSSDPMPTESINPDVSSTPTVTDGPTETPREWWDILGNEDFALNIALWVAMAVAAILIVLIVVLLALRVKQRKIEAEQAKQAGQKRVEAKLDEVSSMVSEIIGGTSMPLDNNNIMPTGILPPEQPFGRTPPPEPARASGVEVYLESVNGGNSYRAMLQGEIIVGRDPSRAKLLLRDADTRISGAHLRLRYSNGVMTCEDISRNGTKVNGQRIMHPTVLRQNDRIQMGSSEMRISWRVH